MFSSFSRASKPYDHRLFASLYSAMSDQGFVIGYIEYLVFIFAPGIGVGELLGVWRSDESIVERIAVAFGIGLGVDTLVLFVKTSGIHGLLGIDLSTVYLVIGIGLATTVSSILYRKKFVFPKKPHAIDAALFLVMLFLGEIIALYFAKYPIFPEFDSIDYTAHVQRTLELINGSAKSLPGGILYDGIHYQFATAVLLIGGEPLVTVQRVSGILVVLSPLLFFVAGRKIFGDARAGLLGAVIYSLSGTIWVSGVFNSGLFPNFFAILAALFLLIEFVNVANQTKSWSSWIVFILAIIVGYLSHYTILTLLPAVLLLPLFQSMIQRTTSNVKNFLFPAIITIIPALLAFGLAPDYVVSLLTNLSPGSGGVVIGSTGLSTSLSGISVIGYIALLTYDDIATVLLFGLVFLSLYAALIRKNFLFFIPLVWFVSVILAAPFNLGAWRYAYEALVPLVLMAGYGISSLMPDSSVRPRKKKTFNVRVRSGGTSRIYRYVVVLVILTALIIGSRTLSFTVDSLSNSLTVSQSQNNVYNAIYWLKTNTPNDSRYLSVSDWRFTYTSLMINRTTAYAYIYSPLNSTSVAENGSEKYILVTDVVTADVPNYAGLFPWNNFPTQTDSNFTLLYSNPDVRVYSINPK